MLKNNLKMAIRLAVKHKSHFSINILGLVVGFASFLTIMLYIYDELIFDQFHSDSDRIHRVVYDQSESNGPVIARINSPGALKEAILAEIPEVEKATRLFPPYWGKAILSNEKYTYFDQNFLYVDESFFDVFSFPFIHGRSLSSLSHPSSIVLTESFARRFFGNKEALGQALKFNQGTPLTVTGIIADVPAQSHLQFDFLIPMGIANRPDWERDWGQGQMYTYIKVKPQARIHQVNAKIRQLVDIHQQAYLQEKNLKETYYTQPLTEIHLAPPRLAELTTNGSKVQLRILFLLAFFILLIAAVNYVNLATARSAVRVKEIGIRKAAGARRGSLISQFLTESTLLSIVAGGLAILLTNAALPYFNRWMGKEISLFAEGNIYIWVVIAVAVLAVGVGAGSYPAFYLSAVKPVISLRKQIIFKSKRFDPRKILVIFQFALASFLIAGMIVLWKQMDYIQSADLGFDKNQVLVIDNFNYTPNRDRNYVVRAALEALQGVEKVGAFNEMVGLQNHSSQMQMQVKGSDNSQSVLWTNVGYNYLEAVGIKLKEGRSFSPEFETPSSRDVVILNETAVRRLGVPEPVIGQQVTDIHHSPRTVIGIVEDFHFTSLHQEIKPFVFGFTPNANTLAVKLSGGDIQKTLLQIKKTWGEYVPEVPMDFYFLDQAIDQQYRSEQTFRSVFALMAIFALIVACLGLFGLATFTANQRTKEIGIRKVFGASVKNIIALLSKEFVKLIVFANIIGWPIAWLAMNAWLENFAYRISIGISTFLWTETLALLVAMIAIGGQTLRAAMTNPIENLRAE